MTKEKTPQRKSYDENKPLWSILTVSRGGVVSRINGLTLSEAKKTYDRLDVFYGQVSHSFCVHKDFQVEGQSVTVHIGSGLQHHCGDGDIEVREVFGPEGWGGIHTEKMEGWPRYVKIYTDAEGNVLADQYQEQIGAATYERNMQSRIKLLKESGPSA